MPWSLLDGIFESLHVRTPYSCYRCELGLVATLSYSYLTSTHYVPRISRSEARPLWPEWDRCRYCLHSMKVQPCLEGAEERQFFSSWASDAVSQAKSHSGVGTLSTTYLHYYRTLPYSKGSVRVGSRVVVLEAVQWPSRSLAGKHSARSATALIERQHYSYISDKLSGGHGGGPNIRAQFTNGCFARQLWGRRPPCAAGLETMPTVLK